MNAGGMDRMNRVSGNLYKVLSVCWVISTNERGKFLETEKVSFVDKISGGACFFTRQHTRLGL